jgi:GNAT superfamily N-acetyltransferase
MKPEPFTVGDIPTFLQLAGTENWVSEQWELEFLLDVCPSDCLVVRDHSGHAIGFVTALVHHKSGWIGNLIVAAAYRGTGIGAGLFAQVLEVLRSTGVKTVWLTASKMGMSLYEKHGFSRRDTINRWVGCGCAPEAHIIATPELKTVTEYALSVDTLAWGDRRAQLLSAVMERGRTLADRDGFVTVQPCGDSFQIGPFAALNERKAEELLESAQSVIPAKAALYLDAPASNHSAHLIFEKRSLRIAGTNELMYCGEVPAYRPELLYGLATMGSCG